MSLDVQLEDNISEAHISVIDSQVQLPRKRATNDDTSTQLKKQKKKNDLPFFDPKRSPFMGRSNDNSLTTRQSLFKDYVDGNDLAKFAAKMSREQLGQQVEFLLNNSPDIEKENWKDMGKVIRSVWRRRSHRNLKIVTDPKINSVLTSLLKSVHYHGDSLFLFGNEKFNVRMPNLMRELEKVSEEEYADVVNMTFGEDSDTFETLKNQDAMASQTLKRVEDGLIDENNFLDLHYAREDEVPQMKISLFDHFLAQDSNVRNLAKKIPLAEVAAFVELAVRSVTNVNLDYSKVYDHVKLTWDQTDSPAHDLIDSPEIFAASASFLKSIYFERANSFKFYPKVFLDWYKCISSALKDDKDVDGVLMLTHQAAATSSHIRNELSPSRSIQVDYDAEAATTANELSVNRDRGVCFSELDGMAEHVMNCFGPEMTEDFPNIEFCDSNEISSIQLSLYDFYIHEYLSYVQSLARLITPVQIEKLVEMALQSITNNKLNQDKVFKFIKSVFVGHRVTADELTENPNLHAFTGSLFKSVFYEGAKTFRHYPKVFISFYSVVLAKRASGEELDAVLMSSYEDLVVQYDGLLSSDPVLFDSNGDDRNQEEHPIRKTLPPVLQSNQEELPPTVVIADNDSSEKAPTAPFEQPPEVSHGADRAQNKRQVIPPVRIDLIQSHPSTNVQAQSTECEQANLLSCKKFTSVEKILKHPRSSLARLVSRLAVSPDATDVICKALYHAKFNPREFARAMELLVTMLEGGSLGNVEDMRFKSVLEAFKKATFHCTENLFLLFMSIFEEELSKGFQSSKTNMAPVHQRKQ